jgi:hypothetical protein
MKCLGEYSDEMRGRDMRNMKVWCREALWSMLPSKPYEGKEISECQMDEARSTNLKEEKFIITKCENWYVRSECCRLKMCQDVARCNLMEGNRGSYLLPWTGWHLSSKMHCHSIQADVFVVKLQRNKLFGRISGRWENKIKSGLMCRRWGFGFP